MKCRSWTSRSVYHSYCGILFGKTGGLTLRAPFAGVLKKIKCEVGEMVQEGVELAEVEPA